jgi:lipoprotein-anchoring transpeptidase ErfK/SrfK
MISASGVFGANPATAAKKPQKTKQISEPGKYSQWAWVEKTTYAYSRPSLYSKKVAKVGLRTPEKTDNLVYIEAKTVGGAPWYKVRLPRSRQLGWIPRSRLGAPQAVSTHIIIDRAARTLKLEKAGRTVYSFRIGIGKSGTPTPSGEFYIRTKLYGFNNPAYGPRAIGLSATSRTLTDWPGGGFIGIHGTNQPGLIPGAISHGCVRLKNKDIVRLFRKAGEGTPVTIR